MSRPARGPHGALLRPVQSVPHGEHVAESVRILLCEDHYVYRLGLRVLLHGEPNLIVAGDVDDVRAACSFVDRVDTDVIVVRQGMLDSPGYQPLRELSASGAAVLVLGGSESELDVVRALRAGARGYLSRRLSPPQLVDAIRAVARDEPALDPAICLDLMRQMMNDPDRPVGGWLPETPFDQFTERQRTVALLAAEGLTNEEIAARLYVSQATVKSHLTVVMRRLDIHSRTLLAVLVHRDARLSV